MVAQGFSEDAVELPHLAQRRGRPAVRRDARLNLFSERCEELRIFREVVEYMGSGLRHRGASKLHYSRGGHGGVWKATHVR